MRPQESGKQHLFMSSTLQNLLFLTPRTCCGTARQKICRTASDQSLELVENARIPPAFRDFLFHSLKCIGDGKGTLIRSFGGQRIIDIDDLQHPGGRQGLPLREDRPGIQSRRTFRDDDE